MTQLNKKGDSPSREVGQSPFSEEEKILKRIPLEITALSVLMALIAAPIFDPFTATFVLAGGALAALSFLWLKQTITKILIPDKKKALRLALPLYVLRIVLILGIFFIIIFFFSNRIIAFAVGFSTMLPVFLVEAALALSKMRQWKN